MRKDVQEYADLHSRLSQRAKRLGARDPDGVASEAILRAMRHAEASVALRYYYGSAELDLCPGWSLGRLTAWLLTTLRYVMQEHYRTPEGRGRLISLAPISGEPALELVTPDRTPEENSGDKEFQRRYEHCLKALSMKERLAILLLGSGASYAEIADSLRCSEGTAASLIYRARAALRNCLGRKDRT